MAKKNKPDVRIIKNKNGYRILCSRDSNSLTLDVVAEGKTKDKALLNMVKSLLDYINVRETQTDSIMRLETYLVNLIENNRGY